MNRKVLGSLLFTFVFLKMLGAAVVSTWTGAHDNNFYDLRNWDVGPREWGELHFTNSVNLICNKNIDSMHQINNTKYGGDQYPHGTTWCIKAPGITVVFAKGESHYVVGSSPKVDVAEGSLLVVSNDFNRWTGGVVKFTKKGAGTWRMCGNMGSFGDGLTVEAGKLEFVQIPQGHSCGLGQISNVVIKSGAELNFIGNPMSHPRLTGYNIEENGILRLTSALNNEFSKNLAALSGAGDVIADGDGCSKLMLTLDRQNNERYGLFTGRVTGSAIVCFTPEDNADDGRRFIVSRADTFKDIRVRQCGALLPLSGTEGVEFIADGEGGGSILRLEDSQGNAYDYSLRITNAPTLSVCGRGNLEVKSGDGTVVLNGANVDFEGALIVGQGAKVQLGNGTAGMDFDLSKESSITSLVTKADSQLTIRPYDKTNCDIAVPVRGCGQLYFATSGMVARNIEMSGEGKIYSFVTTFTGGETTISALEPYTSNVNKGKETVIDGARIMRGESRGTYSRNELPTPDGVSMVGNKGSFNFAVNSGEFAYDSGNGWKTFTMRGGRTWWTKSGAYYSDNGNVVFDGGEAAVDLKNNIHGFYFLLLSKPNHLNYVTQAGGRITIVNGAFNAYAFLNGVLYPFDETQPSGELSFYGNGRWNLQRPLYLTGPVHFRDGVACVPVSGLNGTTKAFGSGELRLTNAEFWFNDDWTSSSPRLDVEGIGYDGVAAICFRRIGGSNPLQPSEVVAGSLRRMGHGAALALREVNASLGDGIHSTFKLANAATNNDGSGFYRDHPVFLEDSIASYFVKYDNEAGFQRVEDDSIATDFAASTKDKLLKFKDSVVIPSGMTVCAAGAKHYKSYNVTTRIDAGATLKLGDDEHPAMFLYSGKGVISGSGALDFGNSEGVIVVSYSDSGECTQLRSCNLICSEVRGNNGISYVAYNVVDQDHRRIRVGASGKYAGDTSIAGCTVVPLKGDVFSTGKVVVKPGERRGGRVRITDTLTLANAFEVGGYGCGDGENLGAIVFDADAALTGPIAITEPARIGAYGDCRGTLAGSISGGRLEIYTEKSNAGTVALTGSNIHTGGTEVIYATLAVNDPQALGTGDMTLNGGTLRFENTSPITVTNDIRGIGRIQLAGNDVKFRCNTRRVMDVTLDIPGTRTRLSELPDFVSGITNTTVRPARLTLGGGNGFKLNPAKLSGIFDLTLEEGSTLDLGGGTLIIRRFTGERSAVNGTINETNPAKGMMMLVR